ncbi:unnamed protein product, partial [Rotaria sordida]
QSNHLNGQSSDYLNEKPSGHQSEQ